VFFRLQLTYKGLGPTASLFIPVPMKDISGMLMSGRSVRSSIQNLILKATPGKKNSSIWSLKLNQLTSDHGWDTLANRDYLADIIGVFKKKGIRVSIFVDPDEQMIEGAAQTGTDRIELYTEAFAENYRSDPEKAIAPYIKAAEKAKQLDLGINAGHDLDLHNLAFLHSRIPWIEEVSIGHALISDALYFGLENVIQLYKRQLK
jgi:pyridoxine 5'-phosphate synthase PdxJ